MGKWIAIIVAAAAVWIGFRFIQFGVKTADLRSAAEAVLASVEKGSEGGSVEEFVSEARRLGFDVDPESVQVTVQPTERESGVGHFIPGTVARMVNEEVRIAAPVRYRIAGPLERTVDITVSDIRVVQVLGATSLDSEPELARELGVAPSLSPGPAPRSAPGPASTSTRRARGVYQGAKERARDLTR